MRLSIRIIQNEQGGFTAVCPSLPGCITKGQTREQAREKLEEAVCGYIAAMSNSYNNEHELIEA